MTRPTRCCLRHLLAALVMVPLAGCFPILPTDGGGMTDFDPPRNIDPSDIALPDGYTIEPVARGLTFPSAITFEHRGGSTSPKPATPTAM